MKKKRLGQIGPSFAKATAGKRIGRIVMAAMMIAALSRDAATAGSPRVNDSTGLLLYPTNFWDNPANAANIQRVAGAMNTAMLGTAITGSNGASAVWMLGMDASGKFTSNAVPASSSSTSSNNFVGSLNAGQIYGLENPANVVTNNGGWQGALQTITGPVNLQAGVFIKAQEAPSTSPSDGVALTVYGGVIDDIANFMAWNGSAYSLAARIDNAGDFITMGSATFGAQAQAQIKSDGTISTSNFQGNGANLTNTPGSIVTSGNSNVTVTPTTNAATGQVTYSVASTGGISSANSNNFTGSLNAGQVYGLGTASLLSSNQLIQEAIANVAGGSATNAVGPNGGTGTNLNLRGATSVDQTPELYATPTRGLFYGDSITQGNYVTNGYCADLAAMGFHNFTVYDWGISSSHLTDVSNLFYGSLYSGGRAYTNYPSPPGTNFFVSFWVGINDCLYDTYPIDTNTWIQSYTNMWWLAHNQGAASIFVFTIEDSTLLSANGETSRANLNSLILQNAQADAAWVTLMNNDLILPSTNSVYFLYNPTANYGLHPNDYGHMQVAQALASQMVLATNLARGAYFNGPVWSAQGFGGSGSNLINVPVSLGGSVNGANVSSAVGMLGIDASGHVTSNAVPASGASTSSNNFVGSLNFGQVYGLGNSATLSSNQLVNMSTNPLATGAYTTVGNSAVLSSNQLVAMSTNALATGAYTTVGNASVLSSNQLIAMANVNAGASTNLAVGVPVIGVNGSTASMMLGVDASGKVTTNAVPASGASTSSNNFVGSLNMGQVYGLGNAATLSSNQIIGMVQPNSVVTSGNANVTVTPATNGTSGQITYAVSASGGSGGGAGVTAGGAVTNIALTGMTGADQPIVPYATPTVGVFYGDTITKGGYNTYSYVGYLTNYGWPHFAAINNAASSAHFNDLSNAFYGAITPSSAYTNWTRAAGTNAWVSFWAGVNDCNTSPLDTNTLLASYTNMWWAAHTNGATGVVVFTVADELTLTAAGETNRACLNNLITNAAALDSPWVTLINSPLILPSTNTTYFQYNGTAGYGVVPTDYGQSLLAQALASALMGGTNCPTGAYFSGPVWAAGGINGNGSGLTALPASQLTGVVPATTLPINTVVTGSGGITVASNSVNGVQTYNLGVGTVTAAPAWLTQRVWSYGPSGSGTTLYGFGINGGTSGTFNAANVSATDPYCIIASTTAVAGNDSTIYDNAKCINFGKAGSLTWRVGLTNTANIRVWMAVSDAATIATADNARYCMGFLESSTNTSANWQFVTENATSHTWTDTGIAPDTNSHTFTVNWDGAGNAYGWIDGSCVATNTTYLPTGWSEPWGSYLTVTTLSTVSVGVRFIQFYGQQSF